MKKKNYKHKQQQQQQQQQKEQIPSYKRNTVRSSKYFNETLVSAYCAITSPHPVTYLSVTGAEYHPSCRHATLF